MSARLLSFVIWALVAASAVFWVNRFVARPVPVPGHAKLAAAAPVPKVPLTRLFGAAPAEADEESPEEAAAPDDGRFKLIGVAAPRPGQRRGWALIAVGDAPARALPVGGRVDASWVVQSISHRQVDLGPPGGAAAVSLTLQAVPEAARGVPGASTAPMAPMAPMPSTVRPPLPQPTMPRPQPTMPRPPPPMPQMPAMQTPAPQMPPSAMPTTPPVHGQPFGAGMPGQPPAMPGAPPQLNQQQHLLPGEQPAPLHPQR